jgi:gamma-glutamyltranspeptidase/glutathione hydrolase
MFSKHLYTFSFALLTAAFGAGAATPPARAETGPGHAAIASAHKLATDAGFEILAQGGNAFDAAVAVASTLAVVEPQSSGIGGGGMFLLHRASDGKDVFVDARETAPAAVDPKDYLAANGDLDKDHSLNGPLSAAIPGEPASWVWLAEHYGKLPLKKSLAPAIRIAREGFEVDKRFVDEVNYRKPIFERYAASKALFLPNGEVPKVGWVFKNPDIAKTLELIAAKGGEGFYHGEFAQRLVDDVKKNGGRWSLEDLASYKVKERTPIAFDYKPGGSERNWHIVTAPPPSSGGIAIEEMLNILSGYDLGKLDSVHRTHIIVEAMRRAYRDRAQYLGDPDFVKMPLDRLASPAYAAELRRGIQMDKATPSDSLPPYMTTESPDTTHFSIIDKDGNRVAVTQTINFVFGSCMVVPGTGFLLNDEMDDFALVAGKPNVYGVVGTDANAPKAGRRPLSSMSPSFIVGNDRIGVIGTPGGSRIITMVLEGLLAFIDGETPEKFVGNPRYHHQYQPDSISAEHNAFTPDEVKGLEAMGHKVSESERTWGFMNAVSWDRRTGELHAGTDPRQTSGGAVVK